MISYHSINSIQNKLEELVVMIRKLKAHIIFISETKIDFTYPDNQCNSPFLAILYTAMTGRKVEVAFWSMYQRYYYVKG